MSNLAMVLRAPGGPLEARQLPEPLLGAHDVLIAVEACGICRTDLHILDGELRDAKRPIVPGHQIVGRVVDHGPSTDRFPVGTRVGVPWLASTCGVCRYCASERENLCDGARFTCYHRDGGFAQLASADERFCFSLDESARAEQLAPLLCAGMVANLTRADGDRFLPLARAAGVRTEVTTFALADANRALEALRNGRFQGAAMLECS